jgi:hypothetical protein
MANESKTIRIVGITPILMHCGQTADPLNQFSKAMSRLSKKRGKTEEDHEEMARLEWWAGLYLSKAPEIVLPSTVVPVDGTKIILPAHLLDSCIREGARKSKLGKQASAGCIVEGNGSFTYDGPKDLVALSQDPRHYHRCAVKVQQSKVMRTRPTFDTWACEFSVCIDTTVIEIEQIISALESAGKLVGIGDWRPGAPRGGSYGRFEVEA